MGIFIHHGRAGAAMASVSEELAQKLGSAMRARHRGRPRQMMPLERTLAGERTPPRQKGISLGEVQNSRGFVGGTTESS